MSGTIQGSATCGTSSTARKAGGAQQVHDREPTGTLSHDWLTSLACLPPAAGHLSWIDSLTPRCPALQVAPQCKDRSALCRVV